MVIQIKLIAVNSLGSGGANIPGVPGVAFTCSDTGNCTCFFEDPANVTVTCTSVGDKLDEIAQALPESTTHL